MQTMVWDWQRGEVVQTIGTMSSGAAYNPTGPRIAASVAFEGAAEIWNAQTGERLAALVGPAEITDITYSPDGTTVATGHVDGSVRLWDPKSGAQQLMLGGSGAPVGHVVFGPDGSTLASVADDGMVWALDVDDLMAIANDRLTRTLTDAECRQCLHIERCRRP
jgi:WD40 repeat protein